MPLHIFRLERELAESGEKIFPARNDPVGAFNFGKVFFLRYATCRWSLAAGTIFSLFLHLEINVTGYLRKTIFQKLLLLVSSPSWSDLCSRLIILLNYQVRQEYSEWKTMRKINRFGAFSSRKSPMGLSGRTPVATAGTAPDRIIRIQIEFGVNQNQPAP